MCRAQAAEGRYAPGATAAAVAAVLAWHCLGKWGLRQITLKCRLLQQIVAITCYCEHAVVTLFRLSTGIIMASDCCSYVAGVVKMHASTMFLKAI